MAGPEEKPTTEQTNAEVAAEFYELNTIIDKDGNEPVYNPADYADDPDD